MPYFNQCLEPNGTSYPSDCWQMCGAASAVILAGQQGKLKYDPKDPQTLKKYMYTDNGQGITSVCGANKGGAFSITSQGLCDENTFDGIQNYLKKNNIDTIKDNEGYLKMDDVKKSIDNGKPVIMGMTVPSDHIFVVTGYTDDSGIVVYDTYRNSNLHYGENAGIYSTDGKEVVYYMNDKSHNNNPDYPKLGYQLFIK